MSYRSTEQTIAIAALIAERDELYEALLLARGYVEQQTHIYRGGKAPLDLATIDAALAKARGDTEGDKS